MSGILILAAAAALSAAPGAAADPAPPVLAAPVTAPMAPAVSAPAPAPVPAAVSGSEPGDIVVTARQGPPPGDPVERINTVSFQAVQGIDKALVGPVAMGYRRVLPEPVRDGLHNAINNISEPVNFVNFLLQLKPGRAARAFGRFAINSTLGIAGLFDVAGNRPFRIAYRRNGFANTFAYYGIGPGPYLYLPLIGPTTVRDFAGRMLDLSLVPLVGGSPFNTPAYSTGSGVLRSLDDRVEFDDLLRKLREECPDSYASERQWYFATRTADLADLHGRKVDVVSLLPECLQPETPPPPQQLLVQPPSQPQPQPQPVTQPPAPAPPPAVTPQM